MPERNFKSELKLDKYNLDDCALNQPELYADWACKWADAVDIRDREKDKLSVTRSDCDFDVRKNPRTFGWTSDKSPTEAFINSAIISHPDYVAANEQYMQTVKEVNYMTVAKDAFEQRRRMIDVLANLYSSQYFSGNKAFDKTYQAVVVETAATEQNEGLAQNKRLLRRQKVASDANTNTGN